MTLLLGGHAIDCRIVDEYHEVAMSMSEHEQLQSCGVLCVCMATIKIYVEVVVVRKTFIIWDESPYFILFCRIKLDITQIASEVSDFFL